MKLTNGTSDVYSGGVIDINGSDVAMTYILNNHSFSNDSSSIGGTFMATSTPLKKFSESYQGIHGYISIVVCIFGIVSNVMNIVVLTRKNMITPTNYILTALALADMLTMASYLPYALYFYCISAPEPSQNHPKYIIIYLLFHNNFIIICHTYAMWLTVALAIFRYIVVCHHNLGPKLCSLYRAKVTIVSVFVATVICCIPTFIMNVPKKTDNGYWWFSKAWYVTDFHEIFNFWLFGVVLKVAPCVLLTVLSSLLIHAMHLANKTRRRLKSQGMRAESERASEHNRTTAMLVAVVLCFVITELPQGTLAFLSGVDIYIFEHVYVPFGDIFDFTVLVNSALNFFLYCIMSRQFRETFSDVFLNFNSCKAKPRPKTPNGVQYSSIQTGGTKV